MELVVIGGLVGWVAGMVVGWIGGRMTGISEGRYRERRHHLDREVLAAQAGAAARYPGVPVEVLAQDSMAGLAAPTGPAPAHTPHGGGGR